MNTFCQLMPIALDILLMKYGCVILHDFGGQYEETFSSRVAVLARPKGGPIQNQRVEYFPYCPTQGSAMT